MSAKYTFPQVAVGAVLFNNDRILLVKRSNPPAKGMWAVPGGKVHPGESLQQALVREIKEETGLDIVPGEIVYVFDIIKKNEHNEITFHYVIIDFLCELNGGQLAAGDDAAEVRWILRNDLDKINVNEKTRVMLKEKFNFF